MPKILLPFPIAIGTKGQGFSGFWLFNKEFFHPLRVEEQNPEQSGWAFCLYIIRVKIKSVHSFLKK
jgi:hypothetical protein